MEGRTPSPDQRSRDHLEGKVHDGARERAELDARRIPSAVPEIGIVVGGQPSPVRAARYGTDARRRAPRAVHGPALPAAAVVGRAVPGHSVSRRGERESEDLLERRTGHRAASARCPGYQRQDARGLRRALLSSEHHGLAKRRTEVAHEFVVVFLRWRSVVIAQHAQRSLTNLCELPRHLAGIRHFHNAPTRGVCSLIPRADRRGTRSQNLVHD